MKTRWQAPGRVNLIGEHTDYNDGFALPFALQFGCTVAVVDADEGWTVSSQQRAERVVVAVSSTREEPVPPWARYVLGVPGLLAERGVAVPPLRIEVFSDVPEGAGLSSSAALVCATLGAVQDHLGLALSSAEMLSLSREVENVVVGSPTGGMDQLASLRGVGGHALVCDMRALTTRAVPFDPASQGLALLVVDTHTPHRHVDGEYAARRQACALAAQRLGVPALRDVELSDLSPALDRLDDDLLRRVVRHVVTENDRVLQTAHLLTQGRLLEIGELLSASHVSMREDFQITAPTVDTAWQALLDAGALGARMTGGGFGGCVIALIGAEDVESALRLVSERFAAAGYGSPTGFTALASPGAARLEERI